MNREKLFSTTDRRVARTGRRVLLTALLVTAAFSSRTLARAEEPDDTAILSQIVQTRDAILKQAGAPGEAAPVFLAFWDFDGTILKGDCSEGLKDGDKPVYPGLAQVCIERGLSALYPAEGGFNRFWTDYTNIDTRIGHWLAYPFIPQMLRGARREEVLRLSQEHFAHTLSNYLMASSVKIIHALQQGGIEPHVISASADLFVKGAAESLGLPVDHIHGIELRTRDGRLTEELVYPVTWNLGKREKVQQIVAQTERERPGRRVYVLAGFGDSYNTDGPFLKFIATQKLPAGRPTAVFYVYDDKPVPEEYRGLFRQCRHNATVN